MLFIRKAVSRPKEGFELQFKLTIYNILPLQNDISPVAESVPSMHHDFMSQAGISAYKIIKALYISWHTNSLNYEFATYVATH